MRADIDHRSDEVRSASKAWRSGIDRQGNFVLPASHSQHVHHGSQRSKSGKMKRADHDKISSPARGAIQANLKCCARLLSGINDPKGLSVSDDEEYDDAYKEIHGAPLRGGALPARAGRARKGGEFRMDRHEGRQARLVALPPDAQGIIRGFVEIAPRRAGTPIGKCRAAAAFAPGDDPDGGNVRLSKLEFPAPASSKTAGSGTSATTPASCCRSRSPRRRWPRPPRQCFDLHRPVCGYLRAFPGGCVGQARAGRQGEVNGTGTGQCGERSAAGSAGRRFCGRGARLNADGKALSVGFAPAARRGCGGNEVIVVGPDGQPSPNRPRSR